ncbi:MAG: oligoendopeptidase F [Clostridia bacterium]|nr:oligoendopeptidase F [Clostridia bacterium]
MQRSEIDEKYLWKTSDVFENDEAWEKAFSALENPQFSKKYKGTLNRAENILNYFRAEEEYEIALMRVYLYAHMKHDEDVSNTKYSSALQKVAQLFTRFSSETAFAIPEISSLKKEYLIAFSKDKSLSDYDYFFQRLIEKKKHILSEKEERILAEVQEPLSTPYEVFEMLDNAEVDLPEIEYEGKTQRISHGLYSVIVNESDRGKRREVFEKYYSAYRKIVGTLAATYYVNVKQDIFMKNMRGFNTSLEMALFEEDVDASVYKNLVNCVNDATPVMHRYMALRKKMMGLDEMHMYDIYPPLVENADMRLTYEEAYETVLKGLAPLGKEYIELLKKGRDERWIDVYETPGKKSGAYSTAVYGVHPFVLLNYQKTTHDVFTIAHEMGHAIHSYFSKGTQPYAKSDYKIFVAEVASTVNEVLLLKYLLNTTKDKTLEKYLVSYFLEMIRTTLFRQTQFAEFEERAHAMAEKGEPLNKDNLSELYYGLNKKYYGDALFHDKEIEIEWARIPHFYNSFYVYKYATGITAAVAIANKILKEGEPAVKKYFEFLSGGCKTDPVSLLKIAGADLTKKETFVSVMKEFEESLKKLESYT